MHIMADRLREVIAMREERQRQEDEIKQFLLDLGAKVEQKEDGYILISLQGTQEKAAPTIKDAFFFWVYELVMSRPGTPKQKKHQFKLIRNYQFPDAQWFEHDSQHNITAWIVHLFNARHLYGVVHYFVDDRAAWIESDDSFGQDKDEAIKWCKEMMKQLAEEQK